jgi:hypothetical protein
MFPAKPVPIAFNYPSSFASSFDALSGDASPVKWVPIVIISVVFVNYIVTCRALEQNESLMTLLVIPLVVITLHVAPGSISPAIFTKTSRASPLFWKRAVGSKIATVRHCSFKCSKVRLLQPDRQSNRPLTPRQP